MTSFKRGDLIKANADEDYRWCVVAAHAAARAALAAADQYWYALNDQSVGLVVKIDPNYIWVWWFGLRSDQGVHKYHNRTKHFNLVSRNGQF